MELLGAVEDTMQLKAMLAVLEIEAGRLEEAERLLAEVADDEQRNQSIFGGTLMVLCGQAELALARGQVDEGSAGSTASPRCRCGSAPSPGSTWPSTSRRG